MLEMSLMDMVLATLGVLITMAMICCLCCMCMKFSDLKMKCYLMELARKKGIQVDLDNLHEKPHCRSPHANENCTIMVPDLIPTWHKLVTPTKKTKPTKLPQIGDPDEEDEPDGGWHK